MTTDYPEHLNPFAEDYTDPYIIKNPFDEDDEDNIPIRRPACFADAMPSPPPRVRRSMSLTPRKPSTPWNTPSTPTLRRQESCFTSTLKRQGSISRFGKTRAAPPPPPVRNGTSPLSTPDTRTGDPSQTPKAETRVGEYHQTPKTHSRTAPSPPVRSETSRISTSQSSPNFSTLQTFKVTQKISTSSQLDINNGSQRIDLDSKSPRGAPPPPVKFETLKTSQLTQKTTTAVSLDQTPQAVQKNTITASSNQRNCLSGDTPTPTFQRTIYECETSDQSSPSTTQSRLPSLLENTSQSLSHSTVSLKTTSESSANQSTSLPSIKESSTTTSPCIKDSVASNTSEKKTPPSNASQDAKKKSTTILCPSNTANQFSNSPTPLSPSKPQRTLVSSEKPMESSTEAMTRCSAENSLVDPPAQSTTQSSTTEHIQQRTPQISQQVPHRFAVTATTENVSQMKMQSYPKVTPEQCPMQSSSQMTIQTRQATVEPDIQSATSLEQVTQVVEEPLSDLPTHVISSKTSNSLNDLNQSSNSRAQSSTSTLSASNSTQLPTESPQITSKCVPNGTAPLIADFTQTISNIQLEAVRITEDKDNKKTEPLKSTNENVSTQRIEETCSSQKDKLKRSDENTPNQMGSLKTEDNAYRQTESLKSSEENMPSQIIKEPCFNRTGSLKRGEENALNLIHSIKTTARQVCFQDEVEEFKHFSDSE